jgi:uncharacterized protein YukJ
MGLLYVSLSPNKFRYISVRLLGRLVDFKNLVAFQSNFLKITQKRKATSLFIFSENIGQKNTKNQINFLLKSTSGTHIPINN